MKYSDVFMTWLREEGYTHCFYLSGGNVMHLLESASQNFECIPFVHEVSAGIAADYFNEVSDGNRRAFVLVTAGPGLTNIVTAIAGAWTESRELLVIGGQAKVSDLSRSKYRQIGFQEIDGKSLCQGITKESITVESQISREKLHELCELTRAPRKGPVFIEFCLDVSASTYLEEQNRNLTEPTIRVMPAANFDLDSVKNLISQSKRPLLLIGGGVPRNFDLAGLKELQLPMATTFNGADRLGFDYPYYCGRPNWYGSRWSNIIIQQADLVIAVGTRLGLLQTGYNFQSFAPLAKVIHVDIDKNETSKGFPRTDLILNIDASQFLDSLKVILESDLRGDLTTWHQLISIVRDELAFPDTSNIARENYLELHGFLFDLFKLCDERDIISPCSSGGTYTGTMQVLLNKEGQKIVCSHALASMGYGLPGAIGMSLAHPDRRVVALEGDGGFAQNMQELGVIKAQQNNIKIFISSNRGYASIRNSQKAYFNGHYIGCDELTGLGFPNWSTLFEAYNIPVMVINALNAFSIDFLDLFNQPGPSAFILDLDPEQEYFPKVGSQINNKGFMESSPLHLMNPALSENDYKKYLPYL